MSAKEVFESFLEETKIVLHHQSNLGTSFMSIIEYCNLVRPEIKEKLYIDRFFHTIGDQSKKYKWLYLDNNLIRWFGYNADQGYKAKQTCTDLIKEILKKDEEYKELSAREFKEFRENPIYQAQYIEPNVIFLTGNKSKHILLSIKGFKKLSLSMKGDRGNQVREYYITIEEVIMQYMRDHTAFEKIKLLYNAEKEREIMIKEQDKLLAIKLEQEEQLKLEQDKLAAVKLEQDRLLAIKLEQEEQLKLELKQTQDQLEQLRIKSTYKSLEQITVKSGKIYCISTNEQHKRNNYKIGKAENTIKRVNQLKTGTIEGFTIFYEIEVFNSSAIEKLLHQIFDATRISDGEFFNYELKRIMTIMKSIQQWEEELFTKINSIISSDYIIEIEYKTQEIKHKIKKEVIKLNDMKEDEAKIIIAGLNITSDSITQDEFIRLLKIKYKPSVTVGQAKQIARLANIYNIVKWNR